tara:strand:+ start:12171 stop:14915 length:2745 start_codon:yes stop_codon:yes gene_type:complete
MATKGTEVELLRPSTDQEGIVRGIWSQNLWMSRGAISVRPGWGQVTELDTTLGLNIGDSSIGYGTHLGSTLVETRFGHNQIVSVFAGRASASEGYGATLKPNWGRYLFVRIFDLETNRTWEEVIHRKTSQNASTRQTSEFGSRTFGTSLESEWYGSYETTYDVDNASFVSGNEEDDFFFHTFQGQVYFGSSRAGIYVYRPADFRKYRTQQLQNAHNWNWANGMSESSLIDRLSFSPGIFQDGYVYATDSVISAPRASCSFRGRLVIATENEVWFSDPGRPNNFIGINYITVPSSNEITAIHALKGNLIIFTDTETFLYVPSEGDILSSGRPPIRITDNVGCVGPDALCLMEGTLVWCAHSGVYSTSNGSTVGELSQPIRSFWGGHGLMTNPMTSYFEANSGHFDITTTTPPRTLLEFNPRHVSIAYHHERRALLVGIPEINGAWAYTAGSLWSWWPTESVASTTGAGAPSVDTKQNLVRPTILSSKSDLFLVTGVSRDNIADSGQTYVDGVDLGSLPSKSGNFVITRLGRGGGLDRSCVTEDHRLGSGKFVAGLLKPASPGYWYFDPPEYSKSEDRYWIPVSFVPPPGTTAINQYELFFKFDNTNWTAGPAPITHAITLKFPTERMASKSGITRAFVTDATKTASATGDHIQVLWDGTVPAGGAWNYQPAMNLSGERPNPMVYIGFRKAVANADVAGFGILPIDTVPLPGMSCRDFYTNVVTTGHTTYVWCPHFIGGSTSHKNDAKAQAVDWAYKSEEIEQGGNQLKARGIFAKLFSHGKATNKIVPGWVWGLYNVVLASDYKDYVSQIVDYDGNIQTIQDKLTIRARLRQSINVMATKIFGGIATWGSAGSAADGNYLIDDEELDEIATSDSVRGSRVSYMVFGFVMNKAESLSLKSLKGVFRMLGGRRRTGR